MANTRSRVRARFSKTEEAAVSRTPTWTTTPIFNSLQEGVAAGPFTLGVNAVGDQVTVTWGGPGAKPSWVTFSAPSAAPTISFNGAQGPANNTTALILLATANGVTVPSAAGTITVTPASLNYGANPSNYTTVLPTLPSGATLTLEAGNYTSGMSIYSKTNITIQGPTDRSARIVGQAGQNTVRISGSNNVTIKNLTIDSNGQGGDGINAQSNVGPSYAITIENCRITGCNDSQSTAGIGSNSVSCWDWIIRDNIFDGCGTGMYLGNSDGAAPFVRAIIEGNFFNGTIGYNCEIKGQTVWGASIPGRPEGATKTIIRNNVWYKSAATSSTGGNARPCLLLGGHPAAGTGANNTYEVYGNFFAGNPTDEPLLQVAGNCYVYNNVFYNVDGGVGSLGGIYARDWTSTAPTTTCPVKNIEVFANTFVIDAGIGVDISSAGGYTRRVIGNAIYAPIATSLTNATASSNTTGTFAAATTTLNFADGALGSSLDLHPRTGQLGSADYIDAAWSTLTGYNIDFNETGRSFTVRGAYSTQGTNAGWLLQLNRKGDGAQAVPLGLSLVFSSSEGYANTTGALGGSTPRLARGQMYYESAYTTRDGTMIEHADGAHGRVVGGAGYIKGTSNRVGEYDPATGKMTEVYPDNWEDHGITSYDNTIYLYFDAIDSLVQFNGGVFSRALAPKLLSGATNPSGETMTNRVWTGSETVGSWSGDASLTGISAWTHQQNNSGPFARFDRATNAQPPPSGRPQVYSSSSTSSALMYTYGWYDGIAQHFGWFNVHSAYSRQFDCAIIIGGASASNQVESPSLSIVIPSGYINSSIVPRYSILFTQMSKAACVVDGARWMLNTGRAACKFIGPYVYWGGGGDQGQSGGPSSTPFVFRADIRPVLANPTAALTTTFLPERVADLPWSMNAGAFSADPYTNTILAFSHQGVALYDATAGSWASYATRGTWTDVTAQFAEYVSTLGGAPYISFPHADFVDYRGATKLRKTYFFGGWDGVTAAGGTYAEKFDKVRSIKVNRGQLISALAVETEDPVTLNTLSSGPLTAIKHLSITENTVPGYYSPGAGNQKITLFSGDWDYGWPNGGSNTFFPPVPQTGGWSAMSDGRQEIWDADISSIPAIGTDGTIRLKLANNYYHNYPWNGSTGYSGAGGFGGVEPQRGPFMPDGLSFIIDKRGQYWTGPCEVRYSANLGDNAGETSTNSSTLPLISSQWCPMYKWTKPGLHSNGVRYGNGWTRPPQTRIKRPRGGGTPGVDFDAGIFSDSEVCGWGALNMVAYDPVNDCIWAVGVSDSATQLSIALYKFPCLPTAGTHTWVRYPLTAVNLKEIGGPVNATGSNNFGDGTICHTTWVNGALYFTTCHLFYVPAGYGNVTSTRLHKARILKIAINSGSPSSSVISWVPFPESHNWWLRTWDGPECADAFARGYTPLTTAQYRSLKSVGNKLVIGPDSNHNITRDPWIWVYDTDKHVWTAFDPPASYSITNGGHDWPKSLFNLTSIPSLGEVWLTGKGAAAYTTFPQAEDDWLAANGMHRADWYQATSGQSLGRRIIRFKVT